MNVLTAYVLLVNIKTFSRVYPCLGNDSWIAFGIFNDVQWRSLRNIIGDTVLIGRHKFSSLAERKANEDELDSLIANWTTKENAKDLETLLQKNDIPCSIVSKSSDLYQDPQLAHRNYYIEMDHPEMGTVHYPHTVGFILSKTPREIVRPSPCLGEHNEFVYKELLGLSDDEISDRLVDGTITTELPAGQKFASLM